MVLVTLADSRHFLGSSSTTRQGTTPSSSPCFLFSLSPPLPLPLSSSSSPPIYPTFSPSTHAHTHTHTHTHTRAHTHKSLRVHCTGMYLSAQKDFKHQLRPQLAYP